MSTTIDDFSAFYVNVLDGDIVINFE